MYKKKGNSQKLKMGKRKKMEERNNAMERQISKSVA